VPRYLLHLIPVRLHRLALRFAHAARLRVNRALGRSMRGCRIVALDADGRVLLQRHTYGSDKWSAPTGGLRRGEDVLSAAARELLEETGCALTMPREVAISDETLGGVPNRVHVIVGRAEGRAVADGREVGELGWFSPASLPRPVVPVVVARIAGWIADWKAQSSES